MAYDDDPEKRNAYMREYRTRRQSGSLEIRRRGRKPLNLGLLCTWEFEWYKAFHLLRDGTQLPPDANFVAANERASKGLLRWWKKVSLKEILGDMRPGPPPPFDELPQGEREKAKRRWEMMEWKVLKDFAELERKAEIAGLERWLKPRETPARTDRRKIWETLADPGAPSKTVEQVCEQWEASPRCSRTGSCSFCGSRAGQHGRVPAHEERPALSRFRRRRFAIGVSGARDVGHFGRGQPDHGHSAITDHEARF